MKIIFNYNLKNYSKMETRSLRILIEIARIILFKASLLGCDTKANRPFKYTLTTKLLRSTYSTDPT